MAREPKLSKPDSLDRTGCRKPRAAERLSQTANRLFYERGIRAVGVDEIVATAGLTKPSLYRSFSSKDDLIVACLRSRFDELMEWWDALDIRFSDDPRGAVRALIAEIANETASPVYRGCAVTNAAVEFPDPGHPAHQVAAEAKAVIRTRLLALIERLPTDQPALLADALILLFEGARACRHTSCDRGPAASLEGAAEALLRALAPEKVEFEA